MVVDVLLIKTRGPKIRFTVSLSPKLSSPVILMVVEVMVSMLFFVWPFDPDLLRRVEIRMPQ